MLAFADRTGLTSGRHPRRYLWTDAFAVCNFLGLGRQDLALKLVDQVHNVLGRHRHDGPWLSGLRDRENAQHPTRGGLRIGKPLDERGPADRFDERTEWDRDGQYFHYLTKWMHALDQVTRYTGQPVYREWARELAQAARRAFVYQHQGQPRMYWKMSADLSRPLVPSMGQHDPLDGYITCLQIGAAEDAGLFRSLIDPRTLATTDPLGIGGLLVDAYRLEQLDEGHLLREAMLKAALRGIEYFIRMPDLREAAEDRLAFRELGLAIGLKAPLKQAPDVRLLVSDIEGFWSDAEHQQVASWREHQDINEVMLATALEPQGFLRLP